VIRSVHVGKVLDNDDPAKRGGLKVQVDDLEDGTALRGGEFVPPSFPFAGSNVGFFFLPAKGALVEVEVESDEEKATEELSPRWRAVLYTDADKIPSEFLSDQTNRGGIKVGSEVLLFDQKKTLLALISSNVRLGEEDASHPVMRGDTYNAELSTYLTAEDAYQTLSIADVAAWKALLTTWAGLPAGAALLGSDANAWATAMQTTNTALAAGGSVWKAAILAFKAKVATWLSTKVKTE
jgi:Type VI secretion system/phage-baseplate injector OB domain